MAESKNKQKANNVEYKFTSLMNLLSTYEKLEELTAKLMELNIRQVDGRITKEDASDDLYVLADVYCDLSQEIFNCKKSMLSDAKSAYVQKQKGE